MLLNYKPGETDRDEEVAHGEDEGRMKETHGRRTKKRQGVCAS